MDKNIPLGHIYFLHGGYLEQLNDQVARKIGIDPKKYGYSLKYEDLAKILEIYPNSRNLAKVEKALATACNISKKITNEDQQIVLDLLGELVVSHYTFRGSRDEAPLKIKEILALLLIDILECSKSAKSRKKVLLIIFDLLKMIHKVATQKSYFDKFGSYTYSEEQQRIAQRVQSILVKYFYGNFSSFGREELRIILDNIWYYQLISLDEREFGELKEAMVKQFYFGALQKENFSSLIDKIKEAKEKRYVEAEILEDLVLKELSLLFRGENLANRKKIISLFRQKVIQNKEGASSSLVRNLNSFFIEPKITVSERGEIIEALLKIKKLSREYLNEEETDFQPFLRLFLDSEKWREFIFDEIARDQNNLKKLAKFVGELKNEEGEVFQQWTGELLKKRVKGKEWLATEEALRVLPVLFGESFFEQKQGEGIIDLLVKEIKKKTAETRPKAQKVLVKILQESRENSFGKYLEFYLLTEFGRKELK